MAVEKDAERIELADGREPAEGDLKGQEVSIEI